MDRYYSGLLIGYSVAVTLLSLALIWKVQGQTSTIRELTGAQALQPGDRISTLSPRTLGGEVHPIRFGANERNKVIFLMSAECHYCLTSLSLWNEIAKSVDPRLFEVVGLATDPPESATRFLQDNEVSFPVLLLAEAEDLHMLKIKTVPQTLLVSATGNVVDNRTGQLSKRAMQEILRRLRPLKTEG